MADERLLRTGQIRCYGVDGREIQCAGSSQDAEHTNGRPWPEPRFAMVGEIVTDRLTGLSWMIDANPTQFPVGWNEAFEAIAAMNSKSAFGHRDWRVPNRRELRSLLSHQEARPALPAGHPSRNRFQGWCWTSTSAAISPASAWYVHLAGARMFYGEKQRFALLWPVCGETEVWLLTGPNINELESLVDCDRHAPALPALHPFRGVGEGYWLPTTSVFEPDWAWALYLVKGAIGVGQKRGRHFRVWPIRDAAAAAADQFGSAR